MVIFSTWKGVEWSLWLHAFGDELPAQPHFWIDLIVLFAWNVSYKALYDLGYVLYNPFGERRLDVAHETIGGGIRRLAFEIAAVDDRMPSAADGVSGGVSPNGTKTTV